MPYRIAWIDTIDACHLKCPTCIRGVRGMKNSGRKMSLELFEQVVHKVRAENYFGIGLFDWTEPFLNRTLEDYVATVKAARLLCDISSTLSFRHIDNLEAVLCAGVDHLAVSTSGYDQKVYQINHVGGRIDYVLANLQRVRDIIDRHQLRTKVSLRFLRFDYNAGEEAKLRQMTDRLRFEFQNIKADGHPISGQVEKETAEDFARKVANAPPPAASDGQVCPLVFDQIVIDCNADVYLCCAFPNMPALRIGPYLEMSAQEILLRRHHHAFCGTCTRPRRAETAHDIRRLNAAERKRRPADALTA
jgi:hypothetical protein